MQLMTRPETAEFSGFYTVHFGRIAAQLYAYLGDRWEAQDLTQEAFCRAFERWDRISAYDLPEAWVRQVAWNLATNRLRHLRVAMRHLAGQREEHVEGPSPDRVALTRALAKLPPKHRLAVVLHHIGQLSTSEIAEQQNVAEGTVRSWLSRGRSQLAERLTDAPAMWEDAPGIAAPGIDKTISGVRRRRAVRRATLAAVVAIMLALPIAIILRSKGSEPPIIGPTSPPSSPSPTPSPSPAVSLTPAAKAISACTGKPLARIPNAPAAVLSGGEPTGRYLVGEISEPAGYRPVLWTDGNPSTFPMPGKILTGLAVSSHGVVAGSTSRDGRSGFSLWTYHDGHLDILHETDNQAEARSVIDINARGDILLSGPGEPRPPSIRLAGPNPVYRDLPLPEGATQVIVHDLGEDGTVVGSAVDGNAVHWTPDLVVHKLPAPVPDGWRASAQSVSGDWAAGMALSGRWDPRSGRPDRVVLRWNLRTGVVNQVPDMDIAMAVTAHGWVLGENKDNKPVLDMDGKRMLLPAISGRSTAENLFTFFTSDDGRVIIGETKVAGSGANIAIGWTCS